MYGIIYCATNTVNGKIYVGQTTMTLSARKACHRINKRCSLFHRAIQKYGFDRFAWSVLEECHDKTELDSREMVWVENLKSCQPEFGYNLKYGGLGNGKHSDVTKRRLSEIAKASGRKPPVNPNNNPTVATRSALSANRGGKAFEAKTKYGTHVGIFVSIGHAATTLNLQRCHIRNNLKGRKKTCCGYVFSYAYLENLDPHIRVVTLRMVNERLTIDWLRG